MPGPWLTTVATVESDLALSPGSDARLQRFIQEATRIIENYVRHPLARSLHTETFRGTGLVDYYVQRTPLISVDSIVYDGDAVTIDDDIAVLEPATIINKNGYTKSSTAFWVITYLGGYLVKGQDISGSTTISTEAADNSFNDSSGSFPILTAGETFVVSGMPTHNGTFTAASGTPEPTASKIPVTATLGDEGPATSANLTFSNQPEDLERACLELVRLLRTNAGASAGTLKRFRLGSFEQEFDTDSATTTTMAKVRDLVLPHMRLL